MDGFLASIIGRSRTVLSSLVFLIFAGTIAYNDIPKEADPEIDSPFINVRLILEGVSPSDSERLILRPLEEKFGNLEGLKKITSTAYQGGGNVLVEFEPWVDSDKAMQHVRDETDKARPEMPFEMEEPVITENNVTIYPIAFVTLYGEASDRVLRYHAQRIRDQITALPGVLRGEIRGLREEAVEIIIDPARLQSYGLSVDDLNQVFSRANRLVAAGKIDTGQGSFSVSVPGLFEDVDDILAMPVKANSRTVVRLRDIADIRRTFKDPTSFVRVNGKPGVSIEVVRRSGENVIAISNRLKPLLERYRKNLPKSVSLDLARDTADNIMNQFNTLRNSVVLAVFLVMALIVAVLGVRSGLLIGMAIPTSFLIGILALYVMGATISIVVMFGMIIAVGMLVDGGIIVVEYADRKMAEGFDRKEAYLLAAQRMAWPTISSTATTIAAFLPLLFWPGVVGATLGFMPITLISVLTASLFVALIFLPTIGSFVGKYHKDDGDVVLDLSAKETLDQSKLTGMTKRYCEWLNIALDHPGRVIGLILASLVLVGGFYSVAGNGVLFFPQTEARRATMNVHGLGNLSVEEKNSLVGEIERKMLEEIGLDDVTALYVNAGGSDAVGEGDLIGKIELWYKEWEERRWSKEILADVKRVAETVPGVRISFERGALSPIAGKPIFMELSSNNSEALLAGLFHIREGMAEVGGFENADDTRPLPGIEWQLNVDRSEAARFGADVSSIGSGVRLVTNGVKLGTFRPDDSEDEVDILVRFPDEFRSLKQLNELRIQTNRGLVPLSNFVNREAAQQDSEILRIDRRRVMTIGAEPAEGYTSTSRVSALKTWLIENPLPRQVRVTYKGEQEAQEQSGSFLIFAFALAMFLMGAILLIQFNSFYSVLLILSSVILSTIGVLFGYIVTGQPFVVVMSGLGLIALAGIVVNNNIVLIDTFDRLIKTADNTREALIQTGVQRLRPVILTTTTTVMGLMPMAFAISVDFFERTVSFRAPATLWWQTLSVTIIFGLLFATILTLVVTPAALMWRANRQERQAQGKKPVRDFVSANVKNLANRIGL